ncbi:MAG: hypothetical protein IH600_17600 [Bacteroidetes bacterium]|nr:hypothetical protein [Bacteroidota bacterium]
MKTTRFLLLFLFFMSVTSIAASPLVVTSNADSGPGTLRAALHHAKDGDHIVFALPSGSEIITIESELYIRGKSLIIDGSNKEPGSGFNVTIQVQDPGRSPWRVFRIDPGFRRLVTISNLLLRGGDVSSLETESDGGVILLCKDGMLTVSRCDIRNGRARNGGGIYAGGRFNRGVIALRDCEITQNEAVICEGEACGGGLYVSFGTAIIHSSRIYENVSQSHSGGFYIFNATGRISNSSIYGNRAPSGSASEGSFCGPSLTIVNSFITNMSSETIAERYRQRIHVPSIARHASPPGKFPFSRSKAVAFPPTLAHLLMTSITP